MNQVVCRKSGVHMRRSVLAKNLILSILMGNFAHLVYAVENSKHQNSNVIPHGSNDLTQPKTLPIVNEAISSINIDNDNDVNLSPSYNANTQRLRHLRDANDDNSQPHDATDNRQRGIQDKFSSYDTILATSYETSYSNVSITTHRNSYYTEENNICTKNLDCGDCIKHPECAWCADPKWDAQDHNEESNINAVSQHNPSFTHSDNSNTKAARRRPRCDLKSRFSNDQHGTYKCALLENPKNKIIILENKTLTLEDTVGQGRGSEFVQISPQRIRLKLRLGEKTKVSFKVANAKKYPVDLYYLMDLSNSMSDDRDTVVKVSKKIVRTIKSITNDFQIGFGSFVDKELMPYISLAPKKNCQTSGCVDPYSFQHQMRLSSNASEFKRRVQTAPISGNIDNPEGGFDALMQVIVCDDEIGWRKDARKVIIFTTDQSFHIAMDGKLGGLVAPNDGMCHLNASGFYTYSKVQDYPSIGHINHLVKEKSISVIWAVTSEKVNLYEGLRKLVKGSLVGVLTSNSSNIVELIRQQYQAITNSIVVETSSRRSSCNTSIINMNCGNGWKENNLTSKQTGECKEVKLGTSVDFELEIELKECKKDRIMVSPRGLNEQMSIDIVPICECECQRNSNSDIDDTYSCNDPACNFHGKLVCGACVCCGDFFGPKCICANETLDDHWDPQLKCRTPYTVRSKHDNSTMITRYEKQLCSGKGACDECGGCVCRQERTGVIFFGKYCEKICDNTSCDRDKYGKLCSGCGICECGVCNCTTCDIGEPGVNGVTVSPGNACQCSLSKCRALNDSSICSGNGICHCDECLCYSDRYTGKYCEQCDTCRSPCETLRACVECVFFDDESRLRKEADIIAEDNDLLDVLYKYRLQDWAQNKTKACPCLFKKLPYSNVTLYSNDRRWPTCSFPYKDCKYTFSYSPTKVLQREPEHVMLHNFNDTNGELVQLTECKEGVDLIGWAFGVIAGIVAVGLVTILLWKAFTSIHDRKEFARFEQERQKMKFPSHSNPIFRQATTTIQNPLFNKPE